MSIYDKASLVLIPSGTKTSKVYSQKPVNGDGDFTFSRSTAATRVNADGLIEKETQNLLLQSNSFTTGWGLSNVTMTSGQAGYDGTNNAWLMTDTNSGAYGIIDRSVTTGGITTFSCYAKSGTTDIFGLRPIGGSSPYVFFDLSNGTFEAQGDTANLIDWDIQDAGGGWYRCSVTTSATATQVIIYIATTGGALAPSGSTLYIQDAQLEQGLVARDYIETTTTAVEGGITDNVPRLDYTDASCPSLLLEPQRTNLSLQSEYFDVTPSVKDASTIEVNGTTSPSGLDDACLFTETTANDRHGFYQYITITAGALTASIFTKEIDRRYIHFQSDATGTGASSYVDLQDGSVVSEGSGWSLSTEDYGNGWYRIKATCTAVAGNKYFIWGVSQNGTTNSYAGSTSKDFTFYGLQLEAGSYATSYIPTYGSAVTRNADASSVTGVADIIGQTEGTAYVEFMFNNKGDAGVDSSFFALKNAAGTSYLNIFRLNTTLAFRLFDNGSNQFFHTETPANETLLKVAFAYKQNDFVLYINGVQEAVDTSGSVGAMSQIHLAGFSVGDNITENYQTMLFKTRLSNAELADLTTL